MCSLGKDRSEKAVKSGEVLVVILKNERDRQILLEENWYRIPDKYFPIRKFKYIAFYQPASFGLEGKRICYYAKIGSIGKFPRINLLPREKDHPRAWEDYLKLKFERICRLRKPIKNTTPRRVSFGLTSLVNLRSAKNILQLYGVVETEEVVAKKLRELKINFQPQYWVMGEAHRYRLDFAIFCRNGRIAVECDNRKAHSSPQQLARDHAKDSFLIEQGWRVVRLGEKKISAGDRFWLPRLRRAVESLDGG